MKYPFAVLVCVLAIGNTRGQEIFSNTGLEFALPVGNWSKDALTYGIGGSGGVELDILDHLGITGNLGFISFAIDDLYSDSLTSFRAIPFQFGARYYFTEHRKGIYVAGEMGVHFFMLSTKDGYSGNTDAQGENTTRRFFSLAPEIGYFFTEKIALSCRCQFFNVTEREGFNQRKAIGQIIGFKLNYNF